MKRVIDGAVGVHLAADDGVGFFHALDGDEKEDLLGGKIEVRVDEDDEFAPRGLRAAAQRLALAGAGELQRDDLGGKFFREPGDCVGRIIGAAVVDQDHLERAEHPQDGHGLLDVGGDLLALVVRAA